MGRGGSLLNKLDTLERNSHVSLADLLRKFDRHICTNEKTCPAGTDIPGLDSQEASEKLRVIHKVFKGFKANFRAAQGRSEGLWKLRANAPFDRLGRILGQVWGNCSL